MLWIVPETTCVKVRLSSKLQLPIFYFKSSSPDMPYTTVLVTGILAKHTFSLKVNAVKNSITTFIFI